MDNKDIVKAYDSLQSIKEVALKYNMSVAKVRKILISEGIYENETSRQVQKLHEAGKSADEIAVTLEISMSCVNMYLPYTKGAYGSAAPTKNALAIRKHRERKNSD